MPTQAPSLRLRAVRKVELICQMTFQAPALHKLVLEHCRACAAAVKLLCSARTACRPWVRDCWPRK